MRLRRKLFRIGGGPELEQCMAETIAARAEADPAEGERLTRAFRERMADDDEFNALYGRPVSEMIGLICQDLGLEPDWDTWAEQDWARAEAKARTPGSPYWDPATTTGPPEPGRPRHSLFERARGPP